MCAMNHKNKARFIWRYGVFGFGLVLALVTIVADFPTGSRQDPAYVAEVILHISLSLLIMGLLVGYAWGWFMWHFLQKLVKFLNRSYFRRGPE